MKIDQAIEILIDFREQESQLLGNEFRDATFLGIEALKREQIWRLNDPGGVINLLPGESGSEVLNDKQIVPVVLSL